jgi:peptidyl-prolyl cis-trans isomerase SurA
MRNGSRIRIKNALGCAALGILATCLATAGKAQPAAQSEVLDRVVAVVNNHAILASDLKDEIQLAALDPMSAGNGALTPQLALEQLISRTLIQQQIRQEDAQAVEPSADEVQARVEEMRRELPACLRRNCASEQGWKDFLAANRLTPERVDSYLRYRLEILRFIELRFRQGILISPEEVEKYYKQTLVSQYSAGETVPALDKVSARIEEILLQQQVNVLFDDWLKNLRSEGEIEVLDPALRLPETQGAQPGGEAKP